MRSILIAMPKPEDSNHLMQILGNSGLLFDIEVCQSASEVLRLANERDFGVVVCGKSMRDMSSLELADCLPEFFGMIMLTKDMSMDIYSDKIMKLTQPLKIRELVSTIETMTSFYIRRIKKKKKAPVKRSIEEEKIISDAKALLMDRNGMSEQEAFRYIQKSSMDTSRSMVESAQMILMLNT